MNKKVIIGAVAGLAVVAGGLYILQVQREAAKWKEAKEIVEEAFGKDGDVNTIRFVSVIDAPLGKVQAALWDVERSAEVVDNISRSKLLKQEENSKLIEMHLQALNLPLQHYTMQFSLQAEAHRIAFKTVESQTQDLEGFYQLEESPDGKRTRVVYESRGREKVAVPVPRSVLNSANRETFVNTMRGIKKSITSPPAG